MKKYIIRDGYIGVFQYIDRLGFPNYRFPGGISTASDDEIEKGFYTRQEALAAIQEKAKVAET